MSAAATSAFAAAICFHGPVRLYSWSDTSSAGFKFKIELLDGRPALEHFEKATKRRGKRAGQRYRAVWQSAEGYAIDGPAELWFAGAQWAHQSGATVTFVPDDPEAVKAMGPTVDATAEGSIETLPKRYLALVQVDEDDQPIDPAKAAVAEWSDGLVGGPKSKAAAMLCQDEDFQTFVALVTRLEHPASVGQCDDFIKRMVGIHSKRLLDYVHPTTHEDYFETYRKRVLGPFLTWAETHGRTH